MDLVDLASNNQKRSGFCSIPFVRIVSSMFMRVNSGCSHPMRPPPGKGAALARRKALGENQDLWRPTAICGDLDRVMRVGLIRFHGSPRPPTSACHQIELRPFFDGAGFWDYAAHLAGSAVICRSAYY
jgi:hypothetical protein